MNKCIESTRLAAADEPGHIEYVSSGSVGCRFSCLEKLDLDALDLIDKGSLTPISASSISQRQLVEVFKYRAQKLSTYIQQPYASEYYWSLGELFLVPLSLL